MKRKIGSEILASVLVNALYAMKNMPVMLVNTLLTPLSFLVVITLVSQGALLGVAIEGALIMTIVSNGLGLQGDLSHLKNDMKLQEMVVSSPTSATVYLLGMAASELIYALPALIILTVLAFFFLPLGILGILSIIGAMVLMFIVAVALGFFFSTLTSDVIQSWAFSGMLSMLLSALPPVYYYITYIPLPYRYLAYISPTTYAAQIAQSAAGFIDPSALSLLIDWVVLIGVAAVFLTIAIKKSRWVEP